MWRNLVKYDDDVINEWDPCYIIGDMAHGIFVDFYLISAAFAGFGFLKGFIIYAAGAGLETRLPQKLCVSL